MRHKQSTSEKVWRNPIICCVQYKIYAIHNTIIFPLKGNNIAMQSLKVNNYQNEEVSDNNAIEISPLVNIFTQLNLFFLTLYQHS